MKKKRKNSIGIFSKPVTRKKWNKKYIGKIYLPEDKDFLEKLLNEDDGKVFINAEGLSKNDLNRLKKLGGVIKKNRKSLNLIIISIAVLIAGGIIFFDVYLKNKLVEQIIETQLERVFLAEVDVKGVDLSVLGGRLHLDHLTVCDAQKPMTNLFECLSIKSDIKTSELLQGRVYVKELGVSGIKRGTKRTSSGALDKTSKKASESSKGSDLSLEGSIESVVNTIGALAGNIDVQKIFEDQKKNFKSFSVIENSKNQIMDFRNVWNGRVEDWSVRIKDWKSTADYVKNLTADSFSTPEDAAEAVLKLEKIYNDAERDYNEAKKDFAEVQSQISEVSVMYNNIESAVYSDYEYIESIINLPAGGKVHWAASILEDQLSVPFVKYLSYLDLGLSWYERVKKSVDKRKAKRPKSRRPGRRLPPPPDAPPEFVLFHAFASGEEPELIYTFDLRNLTSKPEQWAGETSLEIGFDTPSTGAAKALIVESGLSLDVPAIPFDMGQSFAMLDISALRGKLAVKSDVSWDYDVYSGKLDLASFNLFMDSDNPESIVYRLIKSSIEAVKPLSASGSFLWSGDGGLALSVETELDQRLGDSANAILREGAVEGEKLLKEYFDTDIAGIMKDFENAKKEFEYYAGMIQNYQKQLDDYKKQTESKITEIKKYAADLAESQAKDLIKGAVPFELNDTVDDAFDAVKNSFGSGFGF